MPYSDKDDILKQLSEAELIELTDDDELGVVDEAVVTQAIADADEEIDGHLAGVRTLPLSPVPGILRKVSVDIALWNLHSRKDDTIPEIRKERYKRAVRFLEKVAEGKITLGSGDPDPGAATDEAAYSAREQVFTSTTLDRF